MCTAVFSPSSSKQIRLRIPSHRSPIQHILESYCTGQTRAKLEQRAQRPQVRYKPTGLSLQVLNPEPPRGRFTYPGPLPGLACKAMPTRAFCLGLASSVLATCAGTSCSLRDARCRVEDGSEDSCAGEACAPRPMRARERFLEVLHRRLPADVSKSYKPSGPKALAGRGRAPTARRWRLWASRLSVRFGEVKCETGAVRSLWGPKRPPL